MTSLGVATEMSARSSASRTTGAGGWAAHGDRDNRLGHARGRRTGSAGAGAARSRKEEQSSAFCLLVKGGVSAPAGDRFLTAKLPGS